MSLSHFAQSAIKKKDGVSSEGISTNSTKNFRSKRLSASFKMTSDIALKKTRIGLAIICTLVNIT